MPFIIRRSVSKEQHRNSTEKDVLQMGKRRSLDYTSGATRTFAGNLLNACPRIVTTLLLFSILGEALFSFGSHRAARRNQESLKNKEEKT